MIPLKVTLAELVVVATASVQAVIDFSAIHEQGKNPYGDKQQRDGKQGSENDY
ncbi:MAG: hypothetical protein WBM76_03950 [Woeseiaceae bacterium]|jgi:hypothetical protein